MKRKRLHIFLVLLALAVGIVLTLVLTPTSQRGSVTVKFVSTTNVATGARIAVFQAQNSTERLFVRGSSELERRGGPSNTIEVLQITNVDYLQPGATVSFALPCTDDEWRLNFYYVGNLNRREAIVYDLGWALRRRGLLPKSMTTMTWLPQRGEYKFSTEWVQPMDSSDGPSNRTGYSQ